MVDSIARQCDRQTPSGPVEVRTACIPASHDWLQVGLAPVVFSPVLVVVQLYGLVLSLSSVIHIHTILSLVRLIIVSHRLVVVVWFAVAVGFVVIGI